MKFSLDDFKKWMKEHPSNQPCLDKPKNPLIGIQVESKISEKRLLVKIEEQSGDLNKIVQEFIDNGGIIVESEDKRFCIKVDSGTFYIHRAYVTRA
jgi:hypothetical protein